MALKVIQGRNVGLYIEKPGGAFTRILCASSISFEVSTESVETDCVPDGTFASSEPGQISWTASGDFTARQATNAAGPPAETDATDNITSENLLDYQLAGAKFQLRYQLGTEVGSPRYSGLVYITSNSFSSDNKSNATSSVSLQGTGPLTKTLVTA